MCNFSLDLAENSVPTPNLAVSCFLLFLLDIKNLVELILVLKHLQVKGVYVKTVHSGLGPPGSYRAFSTNKVTKILSKFSKQKKN